MRNSRAIAWALLGTLLAWSAWRWCGLASWQDLSTHELFGYWPAWESPQTFIDAWNNPDFLESNGILVQLFYELGWSKLFSGLSLLGLRFPAILASLGSLVLIYLIGQEVSSQRVGILAAFFLATHTLQTSAAIHCRFFSPSTFFMLLSLWLLLKICQRPSSWLWFLYAIAWIGALGNMVLNLLFVPVHIILYLACAPPGKGKYKNMGLVALLCACVFGVLYLRDLGAVARFNYNYSWAECRNIVLALVTQGFTWGNKLFLITFGKTFKYDAYIYAQALATATLLLGVCVCELAKAWRQRRCNYTLFVPLLMVGFLVEFAVITLTIKPLTVRTNTAALWPLTSLVLAQAIGGGNSLSRIIRVLFLMLLFNNAPIFCTDTFIHDRQTPQIAHTYQHYFRPGDIAIIHNHIEIDPYWLTGFTPKGNDYQAAERLHLGTHIIQNLSQGRELKPKVISANREELAALCALIYQSSPPGQRIWVVAHCGDNEPAQIHQYLSWYAKHDVKYLHKETEGVFVMYLVK